MIIWTKDQSDRNHVKPTPEQLRAEARAWFVMSAIVIAFTVGLIIGAYRG